MAIRAGDCFAELIGWHYIRHDWPSALQLLQAMRQRGIAVGPYVEEEMVVEICEKAGGDAAAILATGGGGAGGGLGRDGDETAGGDDRGDGGSEVGEDIDEAVADDGSDGDDGDGGEGKQRK
ncbi:unnamed protein product [Phaeothamnion confervicola]